MSDDPSAAWGRSAPTAPIDLAVAFCSASAICVTIAAAQDEQARHADFVGYALGTAIAVPLATRRRWPVAVLIASAVLLLLYYAADYPAIGVALPLAGAAYTAVAAGHLKAAIVVTGALELIAILYRALAEGEAVVSVIGLGTVADVALLAAVILLAEALRSRRALQAETRERLRALEREREREAGRRAAEERMRIARELHDILAHTIAVINVQAGLAADVLADDPDQARASLLTIRDESREAVGEVKAVLGVLRDDDAGALPRAPTPTLSDLERLVASVDGAELGVEVSIAGRPRPLPPAVELTAYRIAQESLTNVVRHAVAGTVSIALTYESDALTVEIADDGRGGSNDSDRPGYGIAGMHERVRALGGSFEAGPVAGEGFRVHARLPVPSVER